MAVSRLSQTSLQNAFQKYNNTWDGRSAVGSMDALGSFTFTNSSSSSITFSNIPQTYTHLEIKCFAQVLMSSGAAGFGQLLMTFNSDTGSNYTRHELYGDGSGSVGSVAGFASGSYNYVPIQRFPYVSSASNVFGGSVVSVLDYTSTAKTKTVRCLGGTDANGTGETYIASSVWLATPAAISTLTISALSPYVFKQNSCISIYGIK